jgi:hypothetical protein
MLRRTQVTAIARSTSKGTLRRPHIRQICSGDRERDPHQLAPPEPRAPVSIVKDLIRYSDALLQHALPAASHGAVWLRRKQAFW